MQCPNRDCGAECEGKYCILCGERMVLRKAVRTVEFIICTGIEDNGTPCRKQIQLSYKFCHNCAKKVDPQEFCRGNCEECGADCLASERMCMHCSDSESLGGSKEEENVLSTHADENAEPPDQLAHSNNNLPISEQKEIKGHDSNLLSYVIVPDLKTLTANLNEHPSTLGGEATRHSTDVDTGTSQPEQTQLGLKCIGNDEIQTVTESNLSARSSEKINNGFTGNGGKARSDATNEIMHLEPRHHEMGDNSSSIATVIFHAFVSKKKLANGGRVFLIFEKDGREIARPEAERGRTIDKFIEHTCRVNFLKTDLNEEIQYRYGIVTVQGETIFEDYYIQSSQTTNRYRTVKKPRREEVQTLHHYDGIIIRTPARNTFTNLFADSIHTKVQKTYEKHVKHFVRAFTPSWFNADKDMNALHERFEESLDCLHDIIFGLADVYVQDAKLFDSYQAFIKQITNILFVPLFEKIEMYQKYHNHQKQQMARAMSIAIVCEREKVILSYEHWKLICRCLLVHPDPERKTCMELLELRKHFQNDAMAEALLYLIRCTTQHSKDSSWMFCLPIYHLTMGLCQPYVQPEHNRERAAELSSWWGISAFRNTVDVLVKDERTWNGTLTSVVEEMFPLFDMDFYLPRSMTAALKPHELLEIIDQCPVDVLVARLLFWSRQISNKTEKDISECLRKLLERQNNAAMDLDMSLDRMWMTYSTSFEAVVLLYPSNNVYIFMPWARLFMYYISWHARKLNFSNAPTPKDCQPNYEADVEAIAKHVIDWITIHNSTFSSSSMMSYLEMWSHAFFKESHEFGFFKKWHGLLIFSLSKQLHNKLKEHPEMKQTFVQKYCEEVHKFKKPMQECLQIAASKAIDEGYTVNYRQWSKRETEIFRGLMTQLFKAYWKSHVASVQGDQQPFKIFTTALTWPPILLFIRTKGDGCESLLLHDDCTEKLATIIQICESSWDSLVTGHVEIRMLEMIAKHSEVFRDIMTHLRRNDQNMVLKTVGTRVRQLYAIKSQTEQMKVLVRCCSKTSVNTNDIEKVLRKLSELSGELLTEYCLPAAISLAEEQPVESCIRVFDVPKHVLDILPRLEEIHEGHVFTTMWKQTRGDNGKSCTSFEDVVARIWKPVEERWVDFGRKIEDGEIVIEDFEQMFKTFANHKALKFELIQLGISGTIAQTRITQLQEYRQLQSCVHGAKVLLTIKHQYNLTGDFESIKEIAEHNGYTFKMKDFDERLMETCHILRGITDEKIRCLEAFCQCDILVKWLKESMKKSGKNELKVFVDLAMMSAGEEPINIQKVQCLHSAVLGYSALIFDINADCEYSFLLKQCSVVWKELATNPKMPRQLIDTNHELEWWKEIQKAHGSLEKNSLMQTQTINCDGVYAVGRLSKHSRDIVDREIIDVTVPKKGKHPERKYSYSQLQDLQSRLMLVAGNTANDNQKAEVDVTMFTMVFDAITQLGEVLRKLRMSGCIFFNNWKAEFMCNTTRPVCVIITFGDGPDVKKIKGGKAKSKGLNDLIIELAKLLENCHDEWLDYINKERARYNQLNFYTIDQLVILQHELMKIGTSLEPSHLIYPMLSAIKKDCTPDDLSAALEFAKKDVENKSRDSTNEYAAVKHVDANEQDQKEAFVQKIVKSGFNATIVRAYVKQFESKEIATLNAKDAVLWCMVNDFEKNDQVQKTEQGQELSQGNNLDSTSILETCDDSEDVRPLKPVIQELDCYWKTFLSSISSNIKGYMSLEHLGIVLNHLAEVDKIDRPLAKHYIEGEPNLLICATDEILKTTLSIYMHDEDQPLPMSDEVLVSSSSTSIDQVDIFWRRALFGAGRKIHCLVNADLLDYDVSEAAVHKLEEYILETKQRQYGKYRLLIICGSGNDFRSPFVSSLDKYIRPITTTSISSVCTYVKEKLITPKTKEQSAAQVDFKRSSVRLITSRRAGVGKSLYVKRNAEALKSHFGSKSEPLETVLVTIPLQEKHIDVHEVMQTLTKLTPMPGQATPRIFHIDISHEVQEGIDFLLFNLLILDCLMDRNGYVWRRSTDDLYLIETMPIMKNEMQYANPILNLLPVVMCRSPEESVSADGDDSRRLLVKQSIYQVFDDKQFRSSVFQRAYQYLQRLDIDGMFTDIKPDRIDGDPKSCLTVLLRHCGVKNPSWSELHHFVWFLNTQLVDFEQNQFVSIAAAKDLPGFAKFVLRFLIQMSKDFSTRSLIISEESAAVETKKDETDDDILKHFTFRRTWESSPHPYLFFNSDRSTFTFMGFFIDETTGNIKDQQNGKVLEKGIMDSRLYAALKTNGAPLDEDFDKLSRDQKINKLCNVMGIEVPHDPDNTYELTTDNVKKIMAIYMRFRCDIPVIIMGETGCGKTRLVKFMCALQWPRGVEVQNMILMKVHGGTTKELIKRKVHEAEEIANQNIKKYGSHMYTVLFFDEANTTEAIGPIKEIMCDRSICGEPIKLCQNLKIIAACNPYRKHDQALIERLEQAGLGYHVNADDTKDKLGRIPMRRLVYRVQPLPQSLLPIVWDFGQLNTDVEKLYIKQMVTKYVEEERIPSLPGLVDVLSTILVESQNYMRGQKDECSFVSLRDVERVLMVMAWFYGMAKDNRLVFDAMDMKLPRRQVGDAEHKGLDDLTRSLVLALGVCYHACLKNRVGFRNRVSSVFSQPCQMPGGAVQMKHEIDCCQEVFLDRVDLDLNIARNTALKENVFMMVVCIELRIPLFLVGKPGSSKSLAKTVVADAMQGKSARSGLFKHLKQVQMVSFQCSPLSTPDGIVGSFRQCAQFQKDKNLDKFVSVVVLDEVGLAEDSPRMPLKTLHPLLEDGCEGDEKPEAYKKVAFIGISNWALDPAKMNRGILVQREVPDLDELTISAKGICETKEEVDSFIEPFIGPLSKAYLEVFQSASDKMREFYGLRDFYSLVKMVYGFVAKNKREPSWLEMLHSIKRNFGGLELVDTERCFKHHLKSVMNCDPSRNQEGPDCSEKKLIEACLFDSPETKWESRYLLLLTDNYGALTIIQQQLFSKRGKNQPITIFGSSFPRDQEYTQICRNINKIKVCMETGKTVLLLNLENLYESLYDALNQYYVYFGGNRYVDLGLGTHRVKCPVHKDFRLIVVAEKETVYTQFPIPLINRLEKHLLSVNTILDEDQIDLASQLEKWANEFTSQTVPLYKRNKPCQQLAIGDIFIGYHKDTCSAIIMHVCETKLLIPNRDARGFEKEILEEAKQILLWCATPEAIFRDNNLDRSEQANIKMNYTTKQAHSSVIDYLKYMLVDKQFRHLFAQITCHSKLMTANYGKEIVKAIPSLQLVDMISLSSFDTEQQFSNRVQNHFKANVSRCSLLVIQCESGDINSSLIACARYCVMEEFEKIRPFLTASSYVTIVVQLPRKAGGCFNGFQCGIWHSVHIDDLHEEDSCFPCIGDIQGKALSELFGFNMQHENIGENEGNESPEDDRPITSDSAKFETFKMVLQTNHSRPGIHSSNILGLFRQCVQPALAIVKDRKHFKQQRETKRVDIILSCLQSISDKNEESETNTVLTGIFVWLGKLLNEKEHKTFTAQYWMSEDAATMETINKNGTFRRSCYNTIVSKVKPVLAGIFAFLDTNSNFDLLVCKLPWKRKFWLDCFSNSYLQLLKYSDNESSKRESDLEEVIVPSTGSDGHAFKLRLPFSWLIIQVVDDFFRSLVLDKNENDNTEKCAGRLKSHPIGQILTSIDFSLQGSIGSDFEKPLCPLLHEVFEDYVHDFVQTIYNTESDTELMIVCQILMNKAFQMCTQNKESSDLTRHLVCVRFAYEELSALLASFRSINQVWPTCSVRTADTFKVNRENMVDENAFINTVLCLFIGDVNPVQEEMNDVHAQNQWLNKVYRYRPVVETVLHRHGEDEARDKCSINSAKSMWSAVLILKMFLENVTTKETHDDIHIKNVFAFWTIIEKGIDMKEKNSFELFEQFLRVWNTVAIKESIGPQDKCCRCDAVLQSLPIYIPCKYRHILCQTCFQEEQAKKENACPECQEGLDEQWKPVEDINRKVVNEKLTRYQERCNTYFLEVVDKLCFADETPPSDEVLQKLFSYATCTSKDGTRYTKNITIFDSGVDPNPVFRSFLLQLMMRSRKVEIVKYLKDYIENTLVDSTFSKEKIDICLLIVHCWEDAKLQYMMKSWESKVDIVCDAMKTVIEVFNNNSSVSDLLLAIATSRACLEIAAQCFQRLLENNTRAVPTCEQKILQTTRHLCENARTKWPKIYLVKVLCRRYGNDLYHRLYRSLNWIALEDTEHQTEVADRYIVVGDVYTYIREAVSKAVLNKDIEQLNGSLQNVHSRKEAVETFLKLAIHREITCSNVRQSAREHMHGLEELRGYLMAAKFLQDKDQLEKLLNNELQPEFLKIIPGSDIAHQGLQCLLVHFYIVMNTFKRSSTVLDALIMLMNGNIKIKKMFLPTMPQDDWEDIKAVMRNTPGNDERLRFYRCPNGHPYCIGNCGRPWEKRTCPVCGEHIGGVAHNLTAGNVEDTARVSTQTGHILGTAIKGGVIKPERDLKPTYYLAARLFIHMAMFFGPTQQINIIIKPELKDTSVADFLLDHIKVNIADLQKSLNRSEDDVILLMHMAINNMRTVTKVPSSVAQLLTQSARCTWEKTFAAEILNQILENVDLGLAKWNPLLATDNRLGADRLMCLIYETDSSKDEEDINQLLDIPRMWRFRTPITIEHMARELESKCKDGNNAHSILQSFMNEDCLLQALRFVPNILRLQRALLQKYQKKLDKTDAYAIKVKDLKKERVAGSDTERLIHDFARAWEITRKTLEQYGCPTLFGLMFIPKEFWNQTIHDETPLAVFLPSTSGSGLCSYAMLDCLFRKQNDFLHNYIMKSGKKGTSQSVVKPMTVTSAHLISYDHEHDLMPLVLANCHYSFEMGVGTKIEYDFAGIERQLIDRFLCSKSRIELNCFLEIDQMIYRTEVTTQSVFKELSERIPQVQLTGAVRTQICEELIRQPDVCRSLDNLDIAINFLKTTGGHPTERLDTFMTKTLKLENAMISQKARQSCELQHTRSLWLLLSLQKSKLQIEHGQRTEGVFETLQHDMVENLDENVQTCFNDYLNNLSVDKLSIILDVMHEFLLLNVSIRQNINDEDYNDTSRYSFLEGMRAYIAASEPQLVIDDATLGDFPKQVLYKHGANAWVMAYKMLIKKIENKRRH